MPNEKIMRRLEKMLALAERGVGGEKENATRMLEKLLGKHGLTYEDIGVETKKEEHFNYGRKPFSKILMVQIVLSVCGRSRGIYTRKNLRNTIIADCAPHEKIEIELKFCRYQAALKEELGLTVEAFVHKHNLFDCEATEEEEKPERTLDEGARIRRLAAMVMTMPHVEINPALEKL